MDQRCQVLEDGVDVDDVRLELLDGALPLSKLFDVLLLVQQQLSLASSGSLLNVDLRNWKNI